MGDGQIFSSFSAEVKDRELSPVRVEEIALPDNVQDWFSSLRAERTVITPIRLSDRGGEERFPQMNYLPTMNEIGSLYGPGKYRLQVDYTQQGWKKGAKMVVGMSPDFVLAEDGFRDLYEQSKEDREKARFLKAERDAEFARIKGGSSGTNIREVIEVAKMMNGNNGGDGGTLAAVLKMQSDSMTMMMAQMQNSQAQQMAMFQAMMQQQSESSRNTMQMMVGIIGAVATPKDTGISTLLPIMLEMQNKSTQTLIDVVTTRGSDSGEKMMDKFLNMGMKMMEAKAMMEEAAAPVVQEKPSVADRILDGLGQILPHLATLAMMPRPVAQKVIHDTASKTPGALEAIDEAVDTLKENEDVRRAVLYQLMAENGRKSVEQLVDLKLNGLSVSSDELDEIEEEVENEHQGGAN